MSLSNLILESRGSFVGSLCVSFGVSLALVGCSDATKGAATSTSTGSTTASTGTSATTTSTGSTTSGATASTTTGTNGTTATGTTTTGATGTTGAITDASSLDTIIYPFDMDAEGWTVNDFGTMMDDSGNYDPGNIAKLAMATFDAVPADGYPMSATSGSIKIDAPFSAYNQRVDFHRTLSPEKDWTGKVLSVWLKLDSGFSTDASAPGGIVIYAKSGTSYAWGQPAWKNIDAANHTWTQYFFDLSTPDATASKPDFSPAHIVEIGFYIHTGGANNMPDAHAAPMAAVFHADSVSIRDSQ